MSRVVFLIPPAISHMNCTLGVAKELADRGEEVIYFSSEAFREKIEGLGAAWRCYESGIQWYEGDTMDVEHFGLEGLVKQAGAFLFGSKRLSKIMIDLVAQEKPEYIVHDSYSLWGKYIVRQLKVPAVASIPSTAYNKNFMYKDPEGFVKYILRSADTGLSTKLPEIIEKIEQTFRKSYELDDLCDIFVAKGEVNLVYTSKYFQIHADTFDSSYKFVGASTYHRSDAPSFPYDLLDGRPLIYIAMGGVVNRHAPFYRQCLEAFKGSEYQIVLSLGKIDINELGEIPDNFIVEKYIPQLELLKRAKLFVTHGGINSVTEGLANDVPLLCVPFLSDQCWVSHRVESLGAGIYLEHGKVTSEEIRRAAKKIIDDGAYSENSALIGESLRSAGGYKKAADEVLAFKREKGIL